MVYTECIEYVERTQRFYGVHRECIVYLECIKNIERYRVYRKSTVYKENMEYIQNICIEYTEIVQRVYTECKENVPGVCRV